MISSKLISIFQKGSKTYFYTSLFFPKQVRADVFALYAFVRTVDDYVDCSPQQTTTLKRFIKEYRGALLGKSTKNEVIEKFVAIQQKYEFEQSWVDAFISAMEQDLTKTQYHTLKETELYIYGSAEVIGLMMAKILRLPKQSYKYARKLGKAMQFANFIRDIDEDMRLNRCYFPLPDLIKFGLKKLSPEVAVTQPENFKQFIEFQINRYRKWQKKAEEGYALIPKRYLIPIHTAGDLYFWTTKEILPNPLIVFEKKVKPSINQILFTLLKNTLKLSMSSAL